MADTIDTDDSTETNRQCENPECDDEGDLVACRDPADNLLDLCPSCRSEFPVEVLEKERLVADGGDSA